MDCSTPEVPNHHVFRIPILRELWGMPYGGPVERLVRSMADKEFEIIELRPDSVGDAALWTKVPAHGTVEAVVSEGHLERAYRWVHIQHVSPMFFGGCEAALERFSHEDRMAEAAEALVAEMRQMRRHGRLAFEEGQRQLLMPKGSVSP